MTQKNSENGEAILLLVFFKFYFHSQNSENNTTIKKVISILVCLDAQGNENWGKG